MSNVLFPHLYGLAFDVKKTLATGTTIQSAWSLRHETRLSRGPDPINKFSLHYVVLDDKKARDSLNTLEAFFRARRGAYDSFLLKLDDAQGGTPASVTGQVLTPDVGGNCPFVRPLGNSGGVETVFELAGVNGNPGSVPTVKVAGSAITSPADYTIRGPGVAGSGVTYPGMVAVVTHSTSGGVTADFTWYYRMRFEQDETEFDMFHYLLWEAQEIKLMETGS